MEQSPPLDLGSHVAICVLRGTWVMKSGHVKLLGLKNPSQYIFIFGNEKNKPVGFVMQIAGSKLDKILLAKRDKQKTHRLTMALHVLPFMEPMTMP